MFKSIVSAASVVATASPIIWWEEDESPIRWKDSSSSTIEWNELENDNNDIEWQEVPAIQWNDLI